MSQINKEKLRKKNRQKKNFKFYRKWHRRIGIFFSFLILYITISGLFLNHADDLKLSQKYINSTFLLDFYQIKAPQSISSVTLNTGALATMDGQLWFRDRFLDDKVSPLLSAVTYKNINMALFSDAVRLFNVDGELIDDLRADSGLPASAQSLATQDGRVYLKASDGIYMLNEDLTHWHPLTDIEVSHWVLPQKLSAHDFEHLTRLFRSHIISFERFTQDLHSGRIFSHVSKSVMDILGIALLLLSFSGLLMWWRMRK